MTAPRLGPGGVIAGKYSVRAILGDSGSVITYHCSNQQGQDVALKLYDPAVAGHAPVMKALEQAYAATNALPPSSAAPIIDAGYDQLTVAPFSVTELLRLPSLAAMQRRFTPEEVVTLLKGMARSLDLAHLRQVVHGALKPTNVFVGPNSNPVIVTDFAANLPKAAIPTAEGYSLSAPWIAPEQAQSGQVSPAADVFSAALVAFYALTGRTYWRTCQGPQLDLGGWQQELTGPRTPPSSRAAEMGVPLSPSLDIPLFKALSVDANERYRSVGELAGVLEDSLHSQKASAVAIGGGATMALPVVGDAPSPLPQNMQKPRPAAGQSMGGPYGQGDPMLGMAGTPGAATMALPLSALLPGGVPGEGGMSGGGGLQQMGMGGFDPRVSQQNAPAPYGMDPNAMTGPNQAYGQGGMGQGGWQQAQGQGGMNGPGGYGQPPPQQQQGQQRFGQGYGDPGYPPPPVVGTPSAPQVGGIRPPVKSKVVPIVIGLTAVTLLAGVAAVVIVRYRNTPATADTGPVTSTASATPKKDPEPPPKDTATAATTQSASPSASPTPSASAAPVDQDVDVKITCSPACGGIVVDGKVVSPTDPLKLKPGSHSVQVSKPGYTSQQATMDVKAGDPNEKTFTLVEAPQQQVVPVLPHPPCKKNGFVCPCGPGKCVG